MGQPQEIILYPSKVDMLAIALGGGILALISGQVVARPEEFDTSLFVLIVAFLTAELAGLISVWTFYELVKPNPAIIVGREGIRDNASLFSGELLLWEEIADVFPYEDQRATFLGIALKDPEAFLSRQGWIKALVMKRNMRRNGSPVGIPQGVLPVTVDELISQIGNFPKFRRQNAVSPRQK